MNTTHAQIAKNLPSWMWKLGSQAFIKKDFPRHLFIETTATCNLSCSYCPREKIRQDMDFELFRQIIDEAHRYGPRSFSLHLFGEPLLYKRIFEAVGYIKRRNKRNTVLLTTNGTKLNDCIDDFVSCGIDQAYWTWRPEARFRESTLLRLKQWGKFRVRFIDEITPEEARREWADWPNVEGRNIHNYGGTISVEKFSATPTKNGQRHPCYHLWLAPAVAWNGKILICCSDPHQKEVIGQFPQSSIAEAWNSDQMNSVRASHLRGEYEGICKDCDVWKSFPSMHFNFQLKGNKNEKKLH